MANDLLEDLIRQVQRATRAESGLSDFDPTKPLPPLPSVSDTVASLDPSPPELRCKNCNGRLLRGLKSVICVFCGRTNDVVHDPIRFKDTVAYRWLLGALHLDGSEIVEPPLERGDSGRGQSRPDAEIHVSDLLDFKIIWPVEERRTNASGQKVAEGTLSKFPGIDLDNFFHDSRGLDAQNKPEEIQVTRKDVVAADVNATSTNSLSFFETSASSESAVQSSNAQENDDFSGWEADFQSSDIGQQFDGSKSSDLGDNSTVAPANDQEMLKQEAPLSTSSVDISSHLDMVFGSEKNDSTASPSTSDWTSQHTWDEFNPEPTLETKQPDPVVSTEDAFRRDNISNVDLSDQLDSMFGSQQEMSSFPSGPSKSDWTSDDIWDSLSSKIYQAPVASMGPTDAIPQDTMNNPSSGSDWFQLDQWQKSTNEPGNNVISVDEGWDDFTSSAPITTNNATAESHMQSIAASGSTSENNMEEIDFGSFSRQVPSESLVFNSGNNIEEIDFGSFSQADFIQAPSGKGVSMESASEDNMEEIDFGSFSQAGLIQDPSEKGVSMESASENNMKEIDFGSFSQAGLIQAPSGEGVSIDSASENNMKGIDFGSFSQADQAPSDSLLLNSENNIEEIDFGSFSQADQAPSDSLLLNSENKMEEIDFGSFSQAYLPSGKEGGVSKESAADSERAVHVNSSSTGESMVLTDTMGDIKKVSTQTGEDVKMLLSEMHDLSFMLEDKLSFPPKADSFNSF